MLDRSSVLLFQETYFDVRLKRLRSTSPASELECFIKLFVQFKDELFAGTRNSESALALCQYMSFAFEQWEESLNEHHFEPYYVAKLFDGILECQHATLHLFAIAKLKEDDVPAIWQGVVFELLKWNHYDTNEIGCFILQHTTKEGKLSELATLKLHSLLEDVCAISSAHGILLRQVKLLVTNVIS